MAHYGTAEMQGLGQTILDMGRVLQGREAVLRSYADHVTHELKSPLTTLRARPNCWTATTCPRRSGASCWPGSTRRRTG